MSQAIPRNFGKAITVIYGQFSPEQQELMRVPFESTIRYIEETGDIAGKCVESKFRTFKILYRHWLILEKKVPTDYFGKRFLDATTDELWEEAQKLYASLKRKLVQAM